MGFNLGFKGLKTCTAVAIIVST